MTSDRKSRQSPKSAKQLAVAATAAIPVVMLSSMAMAQPATAAAPAAAPMKTAPNSLGHGAKAATAASTNIPAALVAGTVPARVAPVQVSAPSQYTVRAGDTVSAIAARYGLDTSAVLALNGLGTTTLIHPGQVLSLTGTPAPAAAAAAAPAAAPSSGYVVKTGDTVSAIAAAHGLLVKDVLAANGLAANSIIHPGQQLSLGGSSASAAGTVDAVVPSPALVPNTFLNYTYPEAVVAEANVNKAALLAAPVPSRSQMQQLVASTAAAMGVDPSLAQAFALQESGFNHASVSPANAIGTMQVIPDAGEWASGLVGRHLNLLDPNDNVTAGIAIIRSLVATSPTLDDAIAGYYQGAYSVSTHGMYPDTVDYVAAVKANQANFK